MYVDESRCLQCGTRARRTLDHAEIPPFSCIALDGELCFPRDGKICGIGYWCCSGECYRKVLARYLDPRFDFDTEVEDDEDYKQIDGYWTRYYINNILSRSFIRTIFSKDGWISQTEWMRPYLEPFEKEWDEKKQQAISDAHTRLLAHINAEIEHETELIMEKVKQAQRKQQEHKEKERADAAREAERQQKELQRRAEREEERRMREEERKKREEYIAKREAERAEEKRQREEEKRRKEEEEQSAKEAEEEKWTPREFGNI